MEFRRRNDDAAGLVLAEELGVDLVDRAPVLDVGGVDAAEDDVVARHARFLQNAVDVVEREARVVLDVALGDFARVGVDRELSRNVEHPLRDDARGVVALVFSAEGRTNEFHVTLLLAMRPVDGGRKKKCAARHSRATAPIVAAL